MTPYTRTAFAHLLPTLGLLCLASLAHASDLFSKGKPTEMVVGAPLMADTTAGGYPIYPGTGNWRFFKSASETGGARGEATAVQLGWVAMFEMLEPPYNDFVAQEITMNLSSGGVNDYWTGKPCSGTHLVVVNKAQRQDDNCLTIDTKLGNMGSGESTMFVIRSTQSASNGRVLALAFTLPVHLLGLPADANGNWTPAGVESDPAKAAVLNRVTEWAKLLQDASRRALDFSKPQDAFASVPSYRSLMPSLAN